MELWGTVLCAASLLAAAGAFVAAALSDARRFRIPNSLCGLALLFFPLYALAAPQPPVWSHHLLAAAGLLVVGYLMFSAGIFGAGDAKLLAAAGLWAGTTYLMPLLLATALCGALLAAFFAGKIWVEARRAGQAPVFARIPLPYGIAIAAGGLTVLGLLARPLWTAPVAPTMLS